MDVEKFQAACRGYVWRARFLMQTNGRLVCYQNQAQNYFVMPNQTVQRSIAERVRQLVPDCKNASRRVVQPNPRSARESARIGCAPELQQIPDGRVHVNTTRAIRADIIGMPSGVVGAAEDRVFGELQGSTALGCGCDKRYNGRGKKHTHRV
jgi:hypothetical protein